MRSMHIVCSIKASQTKLNYFILTVTTNNIDVCELSLWDNIAEGLVSAQKKPKYDFYY